MESLPESVRQIIQTHLAKYNIILNVVPPRATKMGDWRFKDDRHIITVNGGNTIYQFLLTLVHEIAHAYTWEAYHGSVKPHGPEWKGFYKLLMQPILTGLLPPEDEQIIKNYMKNPSASTTSNTDLLKITAPTSNLVEDLAVGVYFRVKPGGPEFTKISKRRTRWVCADRDGKQFLVPGACKIFSS